MTTKLPIPPIPDLARARGETRDELITWFKAFYESGGAPFNYMSGTRSIKHAYKGLHVLKQLIAGCDIEKRLKARNQIQKLLSTLRLLLLGEVRRFLICRAGNLLLVVIYIRHTAFHSFSSKMEQQSSIICSREKAVILLMTR